MHPQMLPCPRYGKELRLVTLPPTFGMFLYGGTRAEHLRGMVNYEFRRD